MNEAYVNLDTANAYHSARASSTAWAALSDTQKQQRLLEASDYLDAAYRFRYAKTDPNQARQFPRNGMKTIPPEIEQATMILAAGASLPSLTASRAQSRSRVKVGELEVQYSDSSSVSGSLTDFWLIDRLLAAWIMDPNMKFGAIMVGGKQ